MPSAGIGVVALPAGATPAEVATATAAIEATPSVQSVSIDHRRYRDLDPTDEPGWPELWAMENTGQKLFGGAAGTGGKPDVDLEARSALAVTTGDPSVVVAVIDDGIDFSHPDLAAQAWTNPGESGGGKETDGIDNDGNGYIDDVHGWDFCHNDNTVHDVNDDFHGTHVAGTIAAALDGQGVVGVAPSVKLMALKFLGDDDACGFDSQAIEAIAYAKHFGVHIANNSWSGRGRLDSAPNLKAAIADSGMLFVVAAGNDGLDNDQEAFPGPARVVGPAEHHLGGRDRQQGQPGRLLELRQAHGGHRRARCRDPVQRAGLRRKPRPLLDWAGTGSMARRWPRHR